MENDNNVNEELASSCLNKGIAAAIFAFTIAPVGIILGAKGRHLVSEYMANGYTPCGKTRTGSALSNVGFIAGICFTIFWVLYFAIVGLGIALSL